MYYNDTIEYEFEDIDGLVLTCELSVYYSAVNETWGGFNYSPSDSELRIDLNDISEVYTAYGQVEPSDACYRELQDAVKLAIDSESKSILKQALEEVE